MERCAKSVFGGAPNTTREGACAPQNALNRYSGQKHHPSLQLILCVVFSALIALSGTAQTQQAWVTHYNNGITNGTHQAVKMALDAAGNIYVTGFSQNTNSQLGYVTIKYAPNGNQVWSSRYDSINYPSATPAALVLDSNNDVIVTGNALTIKYDPNGNQLWTAPYAGTALSADLAGNAYIVGFGTSFNMVKLAPTGTNLWLTSYSDVGPTVSQSVLVDNGNNVYVSGLDTYYAGGVRQFSLRAAYDDQVWIEWRSDLDFKSKPSAFFSIYQSASRRGCTRQGKRHLSLG